ncbi:MAG: nitroreductase family protein [Methylotenera sp.]|uniref:nitroreductase family protein n=1 Tax=Methylotenera sp. TaxID=2051956 RepID=UPI002488FAFD|nr:nitroreductase family protein [Methylotenera sp.]MDI1308392.1 nitroreductase family protein [Methylotenera sp.]
MHNPANTQVNIDETLANRWSGRAYDANKSVSTEQITALLEAARWAPSCFGDQPWRFVVWDKNTDTPAWQQAFDCLAPSNQTWVKDGSVLLLVCADSLFNHNQQPNRWAQYDTGAAAENLCLQASSMGLMAHQMGGFNADLAREKFSIPAQFTPMAMVCVGYAADIATVTGEALARETAPRSRRLLNELFFAGSWGQPINK